MKKSLNFIFLVILFSVVVFSITLFCKEEHVILEKETKQAVSLEPTVLTGGVIPEEITENTVLKKGEYTVNTNLVIAEDVTLEVEAGSVITFATNTTLSVKGIFKTVGNVEDKVQVFYRLTKFGGVGTFVTVDSMGIMDLSYTIFMNTNPGDDSHHIYSIVNQGTLKMDYVEIDSNPKLADQAGDVINHGKVEVTNSVLKRELVVASDTIKAVVQNSTIHYDLKVALEASDVTSFSQIKNNYDKNGIPKVIKLTGTLVRSVRLYKQGYTIDTSLEVPENIQFIMDAGSNLTFATNTTLLVKGTFKSFGTEEEKSGIVYRLTKFGGVGTFVTIHPTGNMDLSYTVFTNINPWDDSHHIYSIVNRGTAKMNYVEIDSSSKLEDQAGDVVNYGEIEVMNSVLKRELIITPDTIKAVVQNNTIHYDLKVALEASDVTSFSQIKNNYDKNGNQKLIKLTGTLIRSVRLYKQGYMIDTNLEVPENVQFIMEAGSNLTFEQNTIFTVKGILKLLGTSSEEVQLNYRFSEYSRMNTFITIESTGMMESTYGNIMSQILGYELKLVYPICNKGLLKFHNGRLTGVSGTKSYIGNIMNRGDISLIDNDLPGRLTIDEGSSNVDVENNVFGNSITILKKPTGILKLIDNEVTIGSEYVISISFDSIDQNTFRNISGNYRIGERFNAIKITGTPTTNVKLTKQNYVLIDDIVILEGKMFEVEAGSSLQIGDKRSVTVNGVLNISGSLSDPIHITNTSDSYDYRWIGFLISPTGKAFISNTTIMYAGDYYHAPIENQGQLIMWNSEIRQGYSSKAINYNTSNLDQILINNSLHGTVNSNIPLQAAYNYWGYSTGPKVYDPINDKYTGGAYLISNNVSFYPYYSEFVKNDLESIEFLDTYVYEMPHFGQTGVNFTGNYSKQYIDFEFLNINRVYNSKSEKKDIFGFGWSFGYSSRIEPHPFLKNTYLVYLPDSSIAIFEHKENGYVSLNNRSTLEKKNDKYIFTTKEKEVYTYNLEGKLETITDVYGNVTTLTYNKNGLLEKITDHVNRSYTLKYNEDQLVTKITDPIGRSIEYQYQGELLQKVTSFNGMVTEYAYNSKKQLTSIKEDGMRVLGLKYIESGTYKDRIYELTEALGNKKIYSYNGTDSLTIETDSDDRVTKTYYDRDGFEYKVIDQNGTMTTTTYLLEDGANKYGEIATFTKINSAKTIYTRDSVGNVTKITNPDGSTKQYVYNSKNKVVKETDELGNIKEYIYDSDQVTLLKEVIPLNGTTLYSETEDQSKYQMTTYTYYEPSEVYEIPNLVKTKTDQNGTTIYTYDSYGNVISITDANKQKTTYIKNKLDWTLTEQNQYLTEYEYDVSGNVTKVIKDSHLVSMTEYNNRNKPEKVMDGNCNIAPKKIDPFEVKTFETTTCDYSYYRYNALGNLIEETDKEGNITTYSYDQYGNMYFKTNPDGSIELYEFDLLHRLVKSYFKENDESDLILLEEKSYTVGSSSSIITNEYIDEFHVKTKVETYNNRDLLVSEQVGEQTKTKTYLKNGLVSSEKDANGNYTYYYYNKRNLLEKKYEPVSGSSYICTVYVYDVFGRVIEEKVGKGTVSNGSTPSSFVITYYEYNDLGQVIKKKTSSNEEIVYTYDSLGRVTKEKTKMNADIYSLKEYEYNYLDKVVKEKEGDLVTTSEYDNVGNLIKTTSGENVVTTYEYDKKNRLVQKMLDSKVEEKLTYDLNGNITSKTDPNGNVTHYVYDKRNHLLEEKNPKGFLTTYTYDYLGRKLSETTPNGKVMIYTYDDYGNMITKSIGDSTYTYDYDKNNNKVKETTPLGFSTIYTYDKRNRVLTKKDPLGAIHSYSYDSFDHVTSERDENGNYIYYTYDERGNVLQKKVGSVVVEQNEYDLMNHLLKKMDGNSNVTMYTYNVLGQLIKKARST